MKLKWGVQGPGKLFPWSVLSVQRMELISSSIEITSFRIYQPAITLISEPVNLVFTRHLKDGTSSDAFLTGKDRDAFDLRYSRRLALKGFVGARDPNMAAFLYDIESRFGICEVAVRIGNETYETRPAWIR